MNDDLAQSRGDLACIEAVELMTDHLERALPDAERQRLEAHLASCEGCSEYLEQMKALAGSLGGLREAALSAEQRASLIASFRGLRKR
jgi:anti-sigma factor RsiW